MVTTKMHLQPTNLRASRTPRFAFTRRPVQAILASSVAALLGLSAQPAFAATQTWSGASDANWAASGNWGALPATGDSLVFTSATGLGGLTLSDALMTPGTFNVAGITFNSGAGAFVINPAASGTNGFTLTGGVTNNSTSLQTINSLITLSGTQTFTTTAGGGNIALGGVLNGTGGITKAGSGMLTLSGSNSYTGASTVSSGTLQLGNANAVQNSTLTVNVNNGVTFSSGIGTFNAGALAGSGTVTLSDPASNPVTLSVGSNNATTSYSGVLSGSGGITKSGTGKMTITGNPIYTGDTTVNGGTLLFSYPIPGGLSIQSNLTLNGGVVNIDTGGRNAAIATGKNIAFGASSGTLCIVNANFWSWDGTLRFSTTVGAPQALVSASAGGIGGTASFNVARGTGPSDLLVAAPIYGANSVTKTGSGILELSGSNTYTGATTVTSGTLQLSNSNAVQNSTLTVNVNNGVMFSSGIGTFNAGGLAGSGNLVLSDTASNPITLAVGGTNATTTLSGVLSGVGGLTKTGTGTLNLSSTPTYTGSTTLIDGTLATTGTLGGLIGGPAGTLAVYSGTLMLANDSNSFGGAISTAGNTLNYTSIGNYGANSALGTGGSNSVITIGNGGNLVFTGSTAQSSNRNITGTGSSANIKNNGTAALTLSGTIAAKGTLNLATSSTATSIVSGLIVENGGTLGVSVGSNNWRLANDNNSFTGNITASGNTLQFTSIGNYGQPSSLGTGGSNSIIGLSFYGGLLFTGSTTQTSNRNFSISGFPSTLTNNGTAALNLTGTISGSTTFHLSGNYSGTSVISGLLSDSGGALSINGASGTWLLNNDANTFTGSVNSNAMLQFTSVGNYGEPSSLGTGGSNSLIGAAFSNLAFTGSTTQTSNRNFSFGAGGGITGTFYNNGSAPLNLSGTVTISNASQFNLRGSNTGNCGTISGPLVSGTTSSSFTKSDAGIWTLSGTNTFDGKTTIGGGTLIYAKEVSLYNNTPASWTPAKVVVNNGATIGFKVGGTGEFTNDDVTTFLTNFAVGSSGNGLQGGSSLAFDTTNAPDGTFTIPNNIANTTYASFGLTKLGAGTLVLAGTNSFTGATNIKGGTLQFGDGTVATGPSTGTITISSGATLALNLANSGTLGAAIVNSGTMNLLNTGTTTFIGSLNGPGAINHNGIGTTILACNNTSYSTINVNAGAVQLNGSYAAPYSTINVGAPNGLTFGQTTGTVGGLSGSSGFVLATVSGAGVTLSVGNDIFSSTYSGSISGTSSSSALTKIGSATLTLAGSNTYAGPTTITSGTLQLGNANAVQNSTLTLNASNVLAFASGIGSFNLGALSGSANLVLGDMASNPVTLAVGGNNASTTYSGVLSGGGSLIKSGTGTLNLGSVPAYTGSTTLAGGMLATTGTWGGLIGGPAGALAVYSGTLTLVNDSNSFGGAISTAGNTLNYTSIGNYGVNSAVGTGGSNSSITIGNGGNFVFTGSSAQSSNRNVSLAGSSANIKNNGSAALTLSGTIAGKGTLNFASTASGTNTISGPIIESGGTLGIAGNGGTWVLTNANNNFTGNVNGNGLQFTSIGNYGETSSLGTGGSNSVISVGFYSSVAFTGSTTQNSNRNFSFGPSSPFIGVLYNNGTAPLNLSGTVAVGSGAQFRLNGSNSGNCGTISGPMTGDTGTSFIKFDAGLWTLSGSNTYAGSTNISAGTLIYGKEASLYNNTQASWTPAMIQVGNGATIGFNVGGTDEFTNSDVTTLLTNFAVATSGSGMQSGSRRAFDTTNASGGVFTIPDILANTTGASGGAIGLTKLGAGTLVLTGSNTYTGTTTISGGTLQIGDGTTDGVIASSGNIVNNATLAYNLVGSQTYSHAISGSGALAKSGVGALTLSVANTYTGNTAINSGTLILGNSSAIQNSTLDLSGTGMVAFNQNATLGGITGTSNLDMGGRTLSIGNNGQTTSYSGALSNGSLTKIGAGQLTLTGSNTFSGGTTISAGTLAIGAGTLSGTTASLAVNGGVLDLGATSQTVGAVTIAGGTIQNGVLSGASFTSTGGAVSATLGGTGALAHSTGVLTLTGSNTYAGATTVSSGTLQLGNANAVQNSTLTLNASNVLAFASGIGTFNAGGLAGSGALVLADTASSPVTFSVGSNNATTTYSGGLSGGGNLVKTGTGTLNLSSVPTYSGSTTLADGTLATTGTLGGLIGGPGSLAVYSGTLTLPNDSNSFGGNISTSGNTLNYTSIGNYGANSALGTGGSNSVITIGNGGNLVFTGSTAQSSNRNITGTGSSANIKNNGTAALTLSGTIAAKGTLNLATSSTATSIVSGLIVENGGTLGVSVGSNNWRLANDNNSFTGNITASGNTLQFTSIGNYGQPSSLGTGGSNSIIGLSFYGGLLFTGSTTQTSNRNFSITGLPSTLTNNGTAALNLTGTISGSTTLNLAGNYSGTSVISGLLSDSGGSLAVSVTSGKWLLNNDSNSFSGNVGSGSWVYFTSVGNYGQPSSLGTGGSNSVISAGFYNNLGFTGTTTQNSNRSFSFGGGSGFIGALYNNGSAPLNLSGTVTVVNGAQFRLYGSNTGNCGTISGPLVGNTASSFIKFDSGLWTLSGSNTYAGSTNISVGTLMYGKEVSLYNNTPASWTPAIIQVGNGGTIGFNVGGTDEFTSNDVTTLLTNFAVATSGSGLQAGSKLAFDTTNASGGTFTIPDIIANTTGATGGSIGLTKYGTGTLALTGSNTYTGTTTINGGTLQVGDGTTDGVIASSGNIVNNASLVYNLVGSQSYTHVISGTGALTKTGAGTLTLTAVNTFSGGTTINSGTLAISGAGKISGTTASLAVNGGVLDLGTTSQTVGAVSIAGAIQNGSLSGASFTSTGGTVSARLSGTGALTHSSGLLLLSGSNDFSGGTTVSNGTLQIGNAHALGAISGGLTVNGGTLDLNGQSASVGALSGTNGSITSTASGTSTLTTTVTGGTSTYMGSIVDGLGVVVVNKDGAGTLVLSGSIQASGLNANEGSVQIVQSGSIGAISIGAVGKLELAANGLNTAKAIDTSSLSIAAGGTLDLWDNSMILRDQTAGVNQGANLAMVQGLVDAAFDGGAWDMPGITSSTAIADLQAYSVLTVMVYDNTVLGVDSFEGVNNLMTDNGGNQVMLKTTYLGDFDGNGIVNSADYGWLDFYYGYGLTVGDLNGDGQVNSADYNGIDYGYGYQAYGVWNGGAAAPAASAAAATAPASPEAVPEPGALGLLLTGALGLLGIRRQRKGASVLEQRP